MTLEARDQLRAIEAATVPHMSSEDQEETIARLQELAGYVRQEGYRDDVSSISWEDFRQEIRRGIR